MTNNTDQTNHTDQQALRRKVLRWSGLGSVVLLSGFSFRKLFSSKKDIIACAPPESQKIKMLTQDGTLVEVDAAKLIGKSKKITDDQLKNWVNKKQG